MVQGYRSLKSDEVVPKEDALDYVFTQLGLSIEPKNGVLNLEQHEFLSMIEEWYFSGDWIEIEEEEDEL